MRALIGLLLLAATGAASAGGIIETRVVEAASPQIFEMAIKSIRVKDPSPRHQDLSLGTYGRQAACETGKRTKVESWVKRVGAGIGELDMTAGHLSFGYQYEVRPAIEGGEVECWCVAYGKDANDRLNGVCQMYETRVIKEPVFGDATTVVHARLLRFKNQGDKYTVSFEIVPSETVFARELETGVRLSEKERLAYAKSEADLILDSLEDRLEAARQNVANSGRKLQKVESLVTEADRAAAATGPAGLYRLATIDGQTLPYTTIMMGVEVAEGSFVIHVDGKYTQTFVTNRGSVQSHGKYKLNGSSLVLIDKSGMMAGKLTDNREISISGSYGRLIFKK